MNSSLDSFAPREADSALETEAPLLLFRFGGALWALPGLAVREIHALPMLSPMPETAPWVMGMFVLRGEIVPVLDMGGRFGEDFDSPTLQDAVIVLDFAGAPLGILAREVCAVGHFSASQIGALPTHGRQLGLAAPFVAGVTRWEGEIVLVLHLPHLLDGSTDAGSAGAGSRSAPRFDSHPWTPAEREVLQGRALSLQVAPSQSQGEGFDLNSFDLDATGSETRVPTAIFSLGGEEFAVPLGMVREFALISGVASVPCCPPHILGQINLRGEVVTLLDVRAALRTPRLGPPFFAPAATGSPQDGEVKSVAVVVFEHQGAGVGLAVDAVRDVLYLRPDEWTALGAAEGVSTATNAGAGFLARGAIVEGRLLPLLDLARLLSEGLEVDETV